MMAYHLVWSPNALEDLEELYIFYASKNPVAAAKIYNGIIDEVVILKNNPKLGPVEQAIKHRSKKYRYLVVSEGRFKALYFIENNVIYIAGIWNCKQDIQKMGMKYL